MPEILHKGLSASLEDYLETVLAVISEKKAVRAKDIAQHTAGGDPHHEQLQAR